MNRATPTRSEAVLRLVRASTDDQSVTIDGVVATSDGTSEWPTAGTPISLRLELPRAPWMAEALGQLLVEWAEEDAVVTTTLVTTAKHTVARVGRQQSHISLELLATA